MSSMCRCDFVSPVKPSVTHPFFSLPENFCLWAGEQHGLAALHNQHVFVIVMNLFRRHGGFSAGPKCNLAILPDPEPAGGFGAN
jgi:hypothetical protein